MIILPVAAFVLMLLILKKKGIGGRRGFLAATTFWGTSVVLITELLSVPRLVTRGGGCYRVAGDLRCLPDRLFEA